MVGGKYVRPGSLTEGGKEPEQLHSQGLHFIAEETVQRRQESAFPHSNKTPEAG